MSLLKPANAAGRLYAGLYGPEGAGKTRTATDIAMAARAALNLSGPIVAFDTEHAYGFQAPRVKQATGTDLLVCDTRDIKTLKAGLKEAKEANASVCIVDSVTHFLRQLRDDYMKRNDKSSMDVSDYQAADKPFKALLDGMLKSTSNLIICGREGHKYGLKQNTRGKWVNGPIATKMNAGEAGYEVDLLIECRRTTVPGKTAEDAKVVRTAVVKKDRSDSLGGATFTVPWSPSKALAPYFAFLQGDTPEGGA